MSLTVQDLIGIEPPVDDFVNENGTINFSAAEDWVRDNIDSVQDLFGDRGAGLHIGRAQSGLFNYSPGLGLGVEAGGELTIGFGGSTTGRNLIGQPSLEFGVTAAGAIVAGVDWTAGSFDIDLSNERIWEPSLIFGSVNDLQGVAVGVEFSLTLNGVTGGFGAVVPQDGIGDVITKINQQIAGVNFSSSQAGSQALADILSDIFPDGSMIIGLGGIRTEQGTMIPSGTGVSLVGEIILTGVGGNQSAAMQGLIDLFSDQIAIINDCFLGDTLISMWPRQVDGPRERDGKYDESEVLSRVFVKPISEVKTGDLVVSYDQQGNLKPGTVRRTIKNESTHILDFWGVGITPGHATFCAEGQFCGQHVPILDILRTDGAVKRADGTVVRAATGCIVGSEGDKMVHTVTGQRNGDGRVTVHDAGQLRLGTRIQLSCGDDLSILELLSVEGIPITDDGFVLTESKEKVPFFWDFEQNLPKPEDYILARSCITLQEIYLAGEWEAIGTELDGPAYSITHQAGMLLPNIPSGFLDREDAPNILHKYKPH